MVAEGHGLRLTTLNIDVRNYIDRAVDFLAHDRPDVACVQELCEPDICRFLPFFSGGYLFYPMTKLPVENPPCPVGMALFSRFPIRSHSVYHYVCGSPCVLDLDPRTMETRRATERRLLIVAQIVKNTSLFKIATTHFSWTPDGKPDVYQRRDLGALLALLAEEGQFVLCGDFNAPRGGEIYNALSYRYRDCIPPDYTTSIDPELHRIRGLSAMVDGIFCTPEYEVSRVRMERGISDHYAICAVVTKIS